MGTQPHISTRGKKYNTPYMQQIYQSANRKYTPETYLSRFLLLLQTETSCNKNKIKCVQWENIVIKCFIKSSPSHSYIHVLFELSVLEKGNPTADTTASVSSLWHEDWQSATVINYLMADDPTVWLPGFHLPRRQWSLLNRAGQDWVTAAHVERNGV